MLTDAQLADARAAAAEALPDEATIYRRSLVSDGGGGHVAEWGVLGEHPCRISPIGGGEEEVGARISDESTHVVTFVAKQDVSEPDVVEVAGLAYEVTAVRGRGEWEITRRAEVKESPDGIPEVGS